jgi:hypothetical protein
LGQPNTLLSPKEYFTALRQHRDDIVDEVRGRMQGALNGFDLAEVEKQLAAAKGFEDEVYEELTELQEHRSYVLEEADAVKQSARALLTSMDYTAVHAMVVQLETFGPHCRGEVESLGAHRGWLLETARTEMRSAATSADPQFIAATLVKFEAYGAAVGGEAAALATCVAQLKDAQRHLILGATEGRVRASI